MAESVLSLTIFVNDDEKKIYFYWNDKEKGNSYTMVAYRANAFDVAFFDELSGILSQYRQKFWQKPVSNVSLLLPDRLFLTDMITIPNMGKKAVENSLNLVIGTVYKNKEDLTYNTFPLSQTKQTEIYGLVGARTELLKNFRDVCSRNSFNLQNITFVSNAMADGAMAINQKLRTATCLLLDIKEDISRFAFLNKGRTLGTYSLPFGHNMLDNSKLAAEEQLFDYSSARQLVQSTMEKAGSRQMDMAGEMEILFVGDGTLNETGANAGESPKNRSKRELQKLMAHKTSKDAKEFVYKNFRIFVKWALELIASNAKITALGEIDTVYVNVPAEFHFLFDMVNEEQEENGVEFMPMFVGGATPKILEMLGGLQAKQYNKVNNF